MSKIEKDYLRLVPQQEETQEPVFDTASASPDEQLRRYRRAMGLGLPNAAYTRTRFQSIAKEQRGRKSIKVVSRQDDQSILERLSGFFRKAFREERPLTPDNAS